MKKIRTSLIAVIIVSVIIGFGAGVVGELWLNSFLLPDPYLNFKSYSDLSKKIDELVTTQDKKTLTDQDLDLKKNIEVVAPAVVHIYRYKKLGASESLLATDYLGAGMVITNDGWIMTNEQVVLNKNNRYYVQTSDSHVYLTEEVVLSNQPAAAFLKVPANSLPVVEFSLKENLINGQKVFLLDKDGGVLMNAIKNLNYSELTVSSALIHSSEDFYKNILIEPVTKEYLGSPIITLDRKVAGLVEGQSGLVVPMDQVLKTMRAVVQGSTWQRPYLGITFRDLSEAVNPQNKETKGIQVVGVADGSPAKGILLPGDIVLKVENDELSANKNLPELLAQYDAGSTVKLQVKRAQETQNLEVKLGARD